MQTPAPDPITALRFAMQLEKNGRAFYRRVAESTEDPMGKQVFTQLGREEIEHIRLLGEEMTRLKASGAEESEAADGEVDYEEATAKSGIFPALDDAWQIADGATDADALRVACSSEEKAVAFYSELARASTETETRAMYQQLSEMEEQHRTLLQWELDYVLGSGYWCDIAQFDME